MKIEVGKSYRTRDGRKATVWARLPDGLDDQWVGFIGVSVCAWGEDGSWVDESDPDNDDLISEWSEPTPFEKALAEWRARYHPEAVTDFFWNAALDYAACCLDKIRMSGTHTGTAFEMMMHSHAEEIRKARV